MTDRKKLPKRIPLLYEETDPDMLGGDDATPDDSHVFETITDRFTSLSEVSREIAKEGLDYCGLIFGIDYTLSNRMQGQKTFNGKSLHATDAGCLNPYQEVICILGETLEDLAGDGIIRAYAFGNREAKGKGMTPLKGTGEFESFGDVLDVYNEVTPAMHLGGGSCFAPIIKEAVTIVRERKQYHILVLVADGQVVTEEDTIQAIVEASRYPLSIIMIGVGDGPWDVMVEFDDKLPERQFDNFQFVDFHKVKAGARNPQAAVALAALMEIPDQYKAIKELGLLK